MSRRPPVDLDDRHDRRDIDPIDRPTRAELAGEPGLLAAVAGACETDCAPEEGLF